MKKPFTHLGGTSGRVKPRGGAAPTGPKLNLREAPVKTATPKPQVTSGFPGSGLNKRNWRSASGVDRYSPTYQYYRDHYGK